MWRGDRFTPSPSRLNGVGYNNTLNPNSEASFIFGVSFNTIGGNGIIPFKDLGCVEGFADEDQIQTAYTDEFGTTQMKMYVYFGEWLEDEYNTLDPDQSIADPGTGFWIILNDATETFTETSPIAAE